MVPTIKIHIVEPLKTLSDFMDDTKANYNPLSQIVVPLFLKTYGERNYRAQPNLFNLLQELHEQTERRVEVAMKKDAATPYRDDFISGKTSFPL